MIATFLAQNFFSVERKLDYRLAPISLADAAFERCMSHLLGPPLVNGNRITTMVNGKRIFPAMLDALRKAEQTITFETYIYWSGKIGRELSETLAERARAGVRVHVLLDWVGSARLDEDAVTRMIEAGVEVEKYRPLRWYNLSRVNSRTHRKILVIDGRVGFIGGVGIADQWLGDAESPEHWRDTHFQVEGPVVAQLQAAFTDNWTKTHADVLNEDRYFPELEQRGEVQAQVFVSSPREGGDSARLMYLLSIAAARQRILIANAYFVPDDLCVDSLAEAQRNGVRVEVMVPGKNIDTHVTRRASRSRWGKLLAAGVAIYEYQPSMFHCKVMVIDDCWTSVGSTNFDNRSFRLNDEANLNVLDRDFASRQADVFEQDKQRSRRITFEAWKTRPLLEKVLETLAGLLRSQV
ncbi:MAG: cardiolipin synthase [Pirellulales bacterium]|nr:cardiolipin synthase [Pirellulales bacterium]